MDFFFIDEVQFSVRSGLASLSDSVEARQHFFNLFTGIGLCRAATYAESQIPQRKKTGESRKLARMASPS